MKVFKRFLLVFVIIFGLVRLIACKGKKIEPKPELEVYDMSNVKFEDKSFDYDGKAKSITITGTLPTGVTVSYEGNNKVDPGVHTVKANFKGADTHKPIPSMTAKLTIVDTTLPKYDMSGITFEDLEVDWDGKAKSILISGELPEGVTVSYEGNERVRVGTYEIKANFEGADTHQPIPSMTATLTIKETETSKLVDEIEVMLDTIFNLNAQKMFRIEDEKLLFDYHFLAAYSLSVETGFGFGFDIDERVGDSELFPFFHDQISVTSLKQAMDVIQIGRAYNRSLPRGVGDYIVEVTNPESVYNYAPILNVLRETGGNDVLKVNVLDKIPTVVTDNADLDPDTAAAILAASTGYEFETTHIVERIKLFATQDGILGFGDIASSTSTAQVMIGFLTAGISLDIVLEGGNVVNLYEVLKTFYDAELGGFKNQLAQVDLDFNFATPQAFAALACYRAHLITGEKVNLF